jgi:hypothetical protein
LLFLPILIRGFVRLPRPRGLWQFRDDGVKWKLFFRRLSISAPRMTVRSRLPGPVRAALAFLFLALAAAAGVGIYEYGSDWHGPGRMGLAADLERARQRLRDAEAERDRLRTAAVGLENQAKIDRAAQDELSRQVSQLEAERNRLRDDLAFFESLLPAKAGEKGVVIRSFRLQPEGAPAQWRYRLLLQQAGKADVDFSGSVQLQVNLLQSGRAMTVQFPDAVQGDAARQFELSFRHYQRVEGVITLPAAATARSVLVRVVSGGRTVVQQNFSL